jgi:hypothetical protein
MPEAGTADPVASSGGLVIGNRMWLAASHFDPKRFTSSFSREVIHHRTEEPRKTESNAVGLAKLEQVLREEWCRKQCTPQRLNAPSEARRGLLVTKQKA